MASSQDARSATAIRRALHDVLDRVVVSFQQADSEALAQGRLRNRNHTWDHAALTRLSSSQMKSELSRTQKVISSVTGNQAPYMRPPGGATNASVKALAASMGYRSSCGTARLATRDAARRQRSSTTMQSSVAEGEARRHHPVPLGLEGLIRGNEARAPGLEGAGLRVRDHLELIADSKPAK